MLPFWKTLTFWISACSWFIVVGGHYTGVVPSPYGLVLGNVVVLVYAVMRCLQKRQAGQPWKGILFTSEFVGTSATMLANLLDALREIPSLPPRVLVGITAASGLLVTILHHLSGASALGEKPSLKLEPLKPERYFRDGLFPPCYKQSLAEHGAPASASSEAVTEPVRAEDIIATTPSLTNTKKE